MERLNVVRNIINSKLIAICGDEFILFFLQFDFLDSHFLT